MSGQPEEAAVKEQMEADALALAELIYDIYIEKKSKERESESTEDNK